MNEIGECYKSDFRFYCPVFEKIWDLETRLIEDGDNIFILKKYELCESTIKGLSEDNNVPVENIIQKLQYNCLESFLILCNGLDDFKKQTIVDGEDPKPIWDAINQNKNNFKNSNVISGYRIFHLESRKILWMSIYDFHLIFKRIIK